MLALREVFLCFATSVTLGEIYSQGAIKICTQTEGAVSEAIVLFLV